MSNLIIIRHGQSEWNLENRFTGNTDIDLSVAGEMEAANAGKLLRKYAFDDAYTSALVRAVHTLTIILKEIDKVSLPVTRTAAFNERSYGDLQGKNKTDMIKKYGSAQVLSWRRGYDTTPPHGESLKDTFNRVVDYYDKEIETKLRAGKNILIVAHGNSLRALMMHIEKISEVKITDTKLITGIPRLYEFDSGMKVSRASYIH